MNNKNHNQIREWLKNEDEGTFGDRLYRLNWLVSEIPTDIGYQSFFGGMGTISLYEEARFCFFTGQYIASTMLGLAFIEKNFAGAFYSLGDDEAKSVSLGSLLNRANSQGFLSDDEFQSIDSVRKKRNALVHFRTPDSPERIELRAFLQERNPYEIYEEDAKSLILVVYKLLEKYPFST